MGRKVWGKKNKKEENILILLKKKKKKKEKGITWHRECFACATCRTPISGGYSLVGGALTCANCINKKRYLVFFFVTFKFRVLVILPVEVGVVFVEKN